MRHACACVKRKTIFLVKTTTRLYIYIMYTTIIYIYVYIISRSKSIFIFFNGIIFLFVTTTDDATVALSASTEPHLQRLYFYPPPPMYSFFKNNALLHETILIRLIVRSEFNPKLIHRLKHIINVYMYYTEDSVRSSYFTNIVN